MVFGIWVYAVLNGVLGFKCLVAVFASSPYLVFWTNLAGICNGWVSVVVKI